MDPGWLKVNDYTPSAPEELQVSVDTRRDDRGQLQPVLHANWKIKDDGESVCSLQFFSVYNTMICVMFQTYVNGSAPI